MCADTIQTPDYKDTLNLPKTDFPMRARLPKREPEWLARWERIGVYDRLREKKGRAPESMAEINCPNCGTKGEWTDPQQFSGLMKTYLKKSQAMRMLLE